MTPSWAVIIRDHGARPGSTTTHGVTRDNLVRRFSRRGGPAMSDQNMRLHDDVASEPLRPWLPADLLDNAARTIADNKTIMLGLPVLAGIALVALQAVLTEVAVPGGLSGFFGADD